jgi:hypothetical protein
MVKNKMAAIALPKLDWQSMGHPEKIPLAKTILYIKKLSLINKTV